MPKLPGILLQHANEPFSAAALKRLRDLARHDGPSNGTLDHVGRYGLIQHANAKAIIQFMMAVPLSKPIDLDPANDIAIFDCWVVGAGEAMAALQFRNGSHLDVINEVGYITGFGPDTAELFFRGYLFPDNMCARFAETLAGKLGHHMLDVRREPAASLKRDVPRGEIVSNCIRHLI